MGYNTASSSIPPTISVQPLLHYLSFSLSATQSAGLKPRPLFACKIVLPYLLPIRYNVLYSATNEWK
jgi:hypothetical protein